MATFRDWFDGFNKEISEKIEAVAFRDHRYCAGESPEWDGTPFKEVLSGDDPRVTAAFAVEFDSGFGGQDCPNVEIWTATRVYYVREYDGSTSLQWVSRNPAP